MDHFQPSPDSRDSGSEIEITDLPESADQPPGVQTWLKQRALVWQRELARRPRLRRISSLFVFLLLASLIIGWGISNASLFVGTRPTPSTTRPFIFPTRPAFNPYAYPTSSHPQAIYTGHQGTVEDVAWSPDGTRFASGGRDDTVQIWNVVTQTTLIYRGHTDEVTGIAWSPDGRYIASVSRDTTVQVWDANTGERVWIYHDTVAVFSVAWSQRNLLAFGDEAAQVQIWNMQTHQFARRLTGHQAPVVALSWSPDSRRLATGSMDFTARIWQVSTGRTLRVYSHGDVVSTLAWSPDGKYIASGSYDTTVQVWNPATGQRLIDYQDHRDAVYGLSWSPDGTQIASAGGDGMVQVWKLNGQHIITYFLSSTCVSWSSNGQLLAVGDENGQVALWHVS